MSSKVYIIVCSLVVLLVFVSASMLHTTETFESISLINDEDIYRYVIHQTEKVPRTDITFFIIDSGCVYIYYDEYALVNVYTTDGTFKYGIQIATMEKGQGNIAVVDGKLFVHSRLPVIFVFQETQLLNTYDIYSDENEYRLMNDVFSNEKNTKDDIYDYEISSSGTTIVCLDTNEELIELPERLKMVDTLRCFGLLLLWLFIHGYYKLFRKDQTRATDNPYSST